MRNAGLDEAQAGIKIAGRNISNLRYADDTTLVAESEGLKSLLMKVKESEKVSFKLNIQKTKIMASGPTTLCQIDGETVGDYFWGRVPWTTMKLNQSILKEINPDYSLEGQMLKL